MFITISVWVIFYRSFPAVCGALNAPSIGTVDMISDGMVTIVKVTCPTGFSLIGQSTLTCRTDGSWDYSIPTCGMLLYSLGVNMLC